MVSFTPSMHGKLVLLAQADAFQASYLGDALIGAGATILGPARTNAELSALLDNLRDKPSAAVIDVSLIGPAMLALVTKMREKGMAFVSVTTGARGDRADFVAPFAAFQIIEALEAQLIKG